MQNKQIKMVGLDMDGTLLTSDKTLSEYTKKVLIEAMEQGCYVLLATGRPISGIPDDLLHFPGMKYTVTSNGARIFNIETGECIHECLLPVDKACEVLDIFADYDHLQEAFVNGRGYTKKASLDQVERYFFTEAAVDYMRRTRTPVVDVKEKILELGQLPDKVQGVFADMTERQEAEDRVSRIPGLVATSALGNNVEVNAVGADKGLGLLKLGEILGISRDEIMACGDGTNDSSMILAAGVGVAMGNAVDEVKAIADYITLTNDEDGVAKAIEKFVLHRE